jgi:glycosyltransferase involved in cell wall biosynthesis
MKIGVDVTSLLYGRGVSRYTSNLTTALTHLKGTELFLYGSSLRRRHELHQLITELLPNQPEERIAVDLYPSQLLSWLWRGNFAPISKHFPDLDVFHSWDWQQPPDKNLPLVSTIHDLAILKFPETAHPQVLSMHQRSWQVLKEREAHIIAVSQATKKDIIEHLQIPSYRVHVVQEALPIETTQIAELLTEAQHAEIAQKLHLIEKPYILFVGTREPRKNLVRLIQAWQPLARDFRLLIAGESGWDDSEHVEGVQPEFLGRVSDAALAVLYSEASLFAYPSLYEGFGLPILEAFYHGTPVLTSNTSSMPEVAGNAAELVDPESVESIRAGLEKLLTEDLTAQQKRLQRMIVRLHMFSWQKAAEETASVYRKAISAQAEQTKYS